MPRHTRAQKPPKQPKPNRPRVKDLRVMLKGVITTDIGQRCNSLLYVLKWYDDAIIYLTFKQKGQLTPEQRKSLDRVHKSRLQGQGTTFNDEKETAYRTAIRILEKLTDKLLQPAKVDKYYEILDRKKPKMEKKTENWMEKYGQTVDLLQKALNPKNAQGDAIVISVGPIQDEVQKDAELRRFVLRPDVAKQIHKKRHREGLLAAIWHPLVVRELARLAAMEKEIDPNTNQWTGRWMAMAGKQVLALDHMMQNLIRFGQTEEAPKRLVKKPRPEIVLQPGQPKPQRPQRVGFGPKRGPMIAGAFVQGTDIAKLFEALRDGKPHTKKELQQMISTKLDGRLSVIDKKGKERGGVWRVVIKGQEVRLQETAQAAAGVQP